VLRLFLDLRLLLLLLLLVLRVILATLALTDEGEEVVLRKRFDAVFRDHLELLRSGIGTEDDVGGLRGRSGGDTTERKRPKKGKERRRK
jgi:hypothetical protein